MKYTIIVLSLILLLGAGCAVKPINDSLNLSNQDLTSLPNNLLEDTSITELDISNNLFKDVQEVIPTLRTLPRLTHLMYSLKNEEE